MINGWDAVIRAWNDNAPECVACEYCCSQYYTDTGYDTWCLLLDEGGDPAHCAAYDRVEEELQYA